INPQPLTEFYKERSAKSSRCKECIKLRVRNSYPGKEYGALQYKKHRANRLIAGRARYNNNKKRLLASKRAEYERDPALFLKRQKAWREAKSDYVRHHVADNRPK